MTLGLLSMKKKDSLRSEQIDHLSSPFRSNEQSLLIHLQKTIVFPSRFLSLPILCLLTSEFVDGVFLALKRKLIILSILKHRQATRNVSLFCFSSQMSIWRNRFKTPASHLTPFVHEIHRFKTNLSRLLDTTCLLLTTLTTLSPVSSGDYFTRAFGSLFFA